MATGVFPERDIPPANYFYWFTLCGLSAGFLLAVGSIFWNRFRVFRWCFIIAAMGWSLFVGLLGALITYAWFSDHTAAKWNENWLQGNPLSLLLVICVPMYFRWPRTARWVGCIVFGLSAGGLVAKLTPWAWQVNGSIISFMLPIHAGVLVGIVMLCNRTKCLEFISQTRGDRNQID